MLTEHPPAVIRYHSRDLWLADRVSGIGASEAIDVLEDAYGLWLRKLGKADKEIDVDPERLEEGLWAEPFLAKMVSERCPVQLIERPGGGAIDTDPMVVHHAVDEPWFRCTLDFEVTWNDGTKGPCEMKFWDWNAQAMWTEGPPLSVFSQVQWQLAVTGAERALVAAYFGQGTFQWHQVDPDPVFVEALKERGADVWRRVLQARELLEADDDAWIRCGPEKATGPSRAAMRYLPTTRAKVPCEIPRELAEEFAFAWRQRKSAEGKYDDVAARVERVMLDNEANLAECQGARIAQRVRRGNGAVFRSALD